MLQLHVSGLNLLSRCGIAFQNRYLLGKRTSTSISAAVGLAVDAAANQNLRSKMDNGKLLPVEQVKELANDALKIEWEKGVEASGEDTEEGISASRGDATDMAVDLAEFHHNRLAPTLDPIHIQRAWTLNVAGIGMQIAGTIDVQESDAIRDLKTSAKSPQKTVADSSIQLTMYALAVERHDGMIPAKLVLDYTVRTPARKELKLIQLETRRDISSFNPLLERIAAADRTIQSGIFSPADPGAWWCSAKWCSYHSTCPYAVKPVSVAA